jgi:hypothetical protein
LNAAAGGTETARFDVVVVVVVVTEDFEAGPVVGAVEAPDVVVTPDLAAVVVVSAAPGFGE